MTGRIVVGLGIIVASAAMAVCAAAQDVVPALVQIGGDLVDQKGKPLTGLQGVTFALYKEQSDNAPLWVETQTVTADARGHFVALLGATSPNGLPLDLFSTNQARWLGMQAVGQPEHPRTFLASVPYALAQLSVPSTGTQAIESPASITQSADVQKNASTTTSTAAAALSSGPPTVPIFSIVADPGSGLQSANDGAGTVTLSLVKSCSAGQLLKWNGKSWGCTNDTDVKIGVTGGGLTVLANGTSPNIVGGFGGNSVASGAAGATIAGGGENLLNGALCLPGVNCQANNRVTQSFGTVAGGENNQAGDTAGASGVRSFASVGGGLSNSASGQYSTVPGGLQNAATGSFSFAAGRSAKANHDGSFVWADNSSTGATTSTGPNQFLIRAAGGVRVRGPFNLDDSTSNGVGVLQFPTGAGLFLRSGSDNAPYVDRMFISGSTGRVGIGTTSPSQALDVAGSVSASGDLFGANVRASGDVFGANVRATGDVVGASRLCIGSDCRSAWPTSGGGGDGGVSGRGRAYTMALWLGDSTLGLSSITDNFDTVRINPGGCELCGNALAVSQESIIGGFGGNIGPFRGATIAGGGDVFFANKVSGTFGSVGGGRGNSAAEFGTVAGGGENNAGEYATTSGGKQNSASGRYATVTGGASNSASGDFSLAAGYSANAKHDGAFVWADVSVPVSQDTIQFTSTGPNQFLIRAAGGVGIGTASPTKALDVAGGVRADELCIGTDCRSTWSAGGGTITGVTAVSGLDGGGTSGNVSVGIATGGVTNAMLQNPSISLNVSPTSGLTGGGPTPLGSATSLAVDFTSTQKRVSQNCGIGNAIRMVNQDGSVACEPVVAGGGLAGTGNANFLTKFVSPNTVAGSSVFDNGFQVAIGTTSPTATLHVNGGSQPQATGGLFVTTGPASTALFAQTVDTSVYNYAIYGYSAGTLGYGVAAHGGTGVWGDGVRFGVIGNSTDASGIGGLFVNYDPDGKALVARMASNDEALTVRSGGNVGVRNSAPSEALDVNGNVKAVKFIGDGSLLTNLPSGGGGTISGVTAVNGLNGGGMSGNVSVGIATGGVTNAMLQNSSVTLNAGSGLSGSGAISLGGSGAPLSVDFATTQQRVVGVCGSGQAIRLVNQDGSVNCESVVSAGLTGTGNVNSLSKFTGPGTLGNTSISDDGTNVVVGLNGGGLRVLGANGAAPNIVGGFGDNSISSGVIGGTIAGGGFDSFPNTVTGSLGSIGGGYGNSADIAGTVGGGTLNRAFQAATVGGGERNVASGNVATVPGGFGNIAAGAYSFAAGVYANAKDEGAFVWADPRVDPLSLQMIPFNSTAPNQFLIRASGGVGIGTNIVDPAVAALTVAGRVKSDGLCLGSDCRTVWPSSGGGITGVSAGLGLTGGGTSGDVSLGVDFATTQKRLSNNCAAGTAVQSVSQDGIVGCVPVGSSGIGGSGMQDTIPKFLAGGFTVGNSRISDNGADVKLGDDTSGRFSVLGNGTSPNIVGGYKDNSVSAGKVGGTIAGGGTSSSPNVVTASFGSIGGGLANSAGNAGVVAGGNNNDVTGDYGAIGGGRDNRASGAYSTVPGGRQNIASGSTSLAAGSSAQAAHDGTFVWADQSAPGGFTSTDINQFLIRAANGVGIGTSSPTQALDVAGNIKANGLCIDTDCRSAWPSGGGGTITGVIPGAGLAGGGTSGSVSLSIPNGGITNAMLQSSVVTIGAGNGLTGGGIVALGGATNLAINTAVVPRLNVVNTFTAQQNITGSTSAGSGLLMATNSAFGGFGVIGSTSAATGAGGVRGDATATTGSTIGVEGQNFSSSGIGVYGLNTSTTGTNYGVKGAAASGGVGAAGVYGEETSPTGATYGVYGMSASSAGIGVFGTAPSTTGVGTGVLGTAAGTFGAYGVQGQATAATGTTFGGAFSSASNSGTGVYGFVTNTGGGFAGVWGAANSPGAVGGVFENNGGGDLIVARTSAGARFRVANNGNVTATGTFTGGGADFAESVDVLDSVAAYSPGDVLVVDPTSNRRFALSREPYSPLVAGIYSTKPGMLGSRSSMNDKQRADEIPMAVVGIVPTKVSAENGPIERGDLLVTSSTPGYAMKGTDRDRMLGAVVGKALEPLANGAGIIEVLVTVR